MQRARPDLDEILNRHVSDKHKSHGYAVVYHALFKHRRDQPLTLLEIGIGTLVQGAASSMHGYDHDLPGYRPGASLRSWRDYFSKGAIYGVDIQPDTMIVGDARISTALCDSTDVLAAKAYLEQAPRFDVIIDDGVHVPHLQLKTLVNFYPSLKPNGIYVIEDVEPPGSWRQSLESSPEFKTTVADALYFAVSCRRADLVVISKRGDE